MLRKSFQRNSNNQRYSRLTDRKRGRLFQRYSVAFQTVAYLGIRGTTTATPEHLSTGFVLSLSTFAHLTDPCSTRVTSILVCHFILDLRRADLCGTGSHSEPLSLVDFGVNGNSLPGLVASFSGPIQPGFLSQDHCWDAQFSNHDEVGSSSHRHSLSHDVPDTEGIEEVARDDNTGMLNLESKSGS